MLYVGIDWAVEGHTVTLLTCPGKVLESLVVANTLKGFEKLLGGNPQADGQEQASTYTRGRAVHH